MEDLKRIAGHPEERHVRRFGKILACTDFSEPGDRAVDAAFGLCGDSATRIMVTHILDDPPSPNPMYAHYYPSKMWDPESRAAAEGEARSGLRALVPAEVHQAGVAIDLILGHGDAVVEILRIADERQAEIIVVGTQGRTGLAHLLIGSVAERIVRMAKCPVLVVR